MSALRGERRTRRGPLLVQIVDLASEEPELWRAHARASGLLLAVATATTAIDERAFYRHVQTLEAEVG